MFKLFGFTHLLTLFVIIVVCIGFVFFLRYVGNNYDNVIKNILAVLLFSSMLIHYIWAGINGSLSLSKDIPLTLCYITAVFCVIELYIKQKFLFELLFYITIFATFRALIAPDLIHDFPHIKFIQFFVMHLLMIMAIIFIAINYHFKLTFSSVLKSCYALFLYAFFIYNILTGSNYLYLARRPLFKTELNYLGQWSYYFVWVILLIFILFIIIHCIYIIIHRIMPEKKHLS